MRTQGKRREIQYFADLEFQLYLPNKLTSRLWNNHGLELGNIWDIL